MKFLRKYFKTTHKVSRILLIRHSVFGANSRHFLKILPIPSFDPNSININPSPTIKDAWTPILIISIGVHDYGPESIQ